MSAPTQQYTDRPTASKADESAGRWFGLPQPVALAAVPVLGYWLAYQYETGYLDYYLLPSWLVRLDLTHVLVALGVLAFGRMLLHTTLRYFPAKEATAAGWNLLMFVSLLMLPAFFVALAWLTFNATEWVWGPHLRWPVVRIAGLLSFAIGTFHSNVIRPLRDPKRTGTRMQRWRAQAIANATATVIKPSSADPGPQRTLTHALESSIERVTVAGAANVLLVFLLLGYGTDIVGTMGARYQRTFLLSKSEPLCIGIRRYGDVSLPR